MIAQHLTRVTRVPRVTPKHQRDSAKKTSIVEGGGGALGLAGGVATGGVARCGYLQPDQVWLREARCAAQGPVSLAGQGPVSLAGQGPARSCAAEVMVWLRGGGG